MRAGADKCKLICNYCELENVPNANMAGFKREPLHLGRPAKLSREKVGVVLGPIFVLPMTSAGVVSITGNSSVEVDLLVIEPLFVLLPVGKQQVDEVINYVLLDIHLGQ